jgi:hypothetical protein
MATMIGLSIASCGCMYAGERSELPELTSNNSVLGFDGNRAVGEDAKNGEWRTKRKTVVDIPRYVLLDPLSSAERGCAELDPVRGHETRLQEPESNRTAIPRRPWETVFYTMPTAWLPVSR